MTLEPCSRCKRHVVASAVRCPFCAAVLHRDRAPRPRLVGRASRAAVFAGATLAGCYTSSPRPAQPRPPDEQRAVDDTPPPPPPPDTGFSQPPPDSTPVGTAELRGQITVAPQGTPWRTTVELFAQGQPTATTVSDSNGEYVFAGLAAGTYTVSVEQPQPNNPRHNRQRPVQQQVQITAGARVRADVTVHAAPQVIDTGPCCKPYGAPPARRRVV